MKLAVYATGPSTIMTLPVVEWGKRPKDKPSSYKQALTAFVSYHGEILPAKDFPRFAIIVPEEELADPDVLRIAASAWQGED